MPFKVHSESDSHFECEGDKGTFKVAKKGLHPARVQRLQGMCNGGEVKGYARGGKVTNPLEEAIGRYAESPTPNADQQLGPEGVLARREQVMKMILGGVKSIFTDKDPSVAAMNAVHPLVGIMSVAGRSASKAVAEKAVKYAERGVSSIPWDSMNLEEATKAAQLGRHLMRDSTGQYIGAPRGIDTPQKLKAMRSMVDEAVKLGGFNKDWYQRASGALMEVAGGDKGKADLFAKMLGVTSPGTTQGSNFNMALGAMNRSALEGPASVASHPEGFRFGGAQAKNAAELLANPESTAGLGSKTLPYYQQLANAIEGGSGVRTVNDMQVGRTFGYQNIGKHTGEPFERGFSDPEHSFLTGEQLLAARRGGTTPQGARASEWAAAKLKSGESGQAAYGSPKELIEGDKYTAFENTEATPGSNTGHLRGLAQSPELNARYSADPRATYLDKNNQDLFYREAGMLQRPGLPQQGEYLNSQGVMEYNPGLRLRPLVSFKPGVKSMTHSELGDPDQKLLDAINSWRTALDAQEMGAYQAPRGIQSTRVLPWGPEGSGQVTKTLVEGGKDVPPLDPRLAARFDASQELRARIGAKNDLDMETARQSGIGQPRADLMQLRDTLNRRGFSGLAQHVEKFGYAGLPAVAVGLGETIGWREPKPEDPDAQ